MESSVQRTVDCALYIQEKYGSYLCKDVDITIKVKIGVGTGITHFSGIGTEGFQQWVIFGPGVQAASAAEKHCASGDIVLDPSAWAHCSPPNYRFSLKEKPFVHIFDIANFINFEKRGRPQFFWKGKNERRDSSGISPELEKIRPHIKIAVDRKPEAIMRPFVIPPVLRKLDDDIPVEYLNESRVVCICFIQLKTDEKVDADEKTFRENMATIVQRAFVRIYQNVTKLQGALSKVIMFDKGLTYLVVFGLPGYINENQSAHALKFAFRTKTALKNIKFVTEVSIGVSTGSCYCGILGHPRRQEYTVIGRKVNKAARLMCSYPGKLTCDQDTVYFSKFPMDNFKLMEAKELKGIKDAGKIYEYLNIDTSDDSSIPYFQYPLLGRQAELQYFRGALSRTQNDMEQHNNAGTLHRHQDPGVVSKSIWMIIFEGDNGIGKSRMLGACLQEAENLHLRVFNVGMSLASSSQPFFAISSLVIDALGMLDLRTVQEREEYLRRHVNDSDLAADLCLINEILHTKFPLNPKYTTLDVNAGHTYGQHVLSSLLKSTYPDSLILFVVDDAHLMDIRSWEYLVYISKSPNLFALCSLRRSNAGSPKLSDSVTKQIYHNKSIKIIRLTGLDSKLLLPLACQIMQVKAIPADLEKLITSKSNGVPAWVTQVLNELLRTGVIRLQEDSGRYKQAMVNADKKHLEKLKKNIKRNLRRWAQEDDDGGGTPSTTNQAIRAASIAREEIVDPFERVLVIKSDTNIQNVPVSGTLQEIILDAYDELNPNEQIILKAATVLGVRFSREMLTKLLPQYELASRKYDQSINRLMELKYVRCASGTTKQREQASAINAKPMCFCMLEGYMDDPDSGLNIEWRPKYYACKFMEFVKENMVEVIYDLMTQDQRAKMHLEAAKYLDSTSVRCESCGGEDRSHLYGFTRKANEFSEAEDALQFQSKTGKRNVSKALQREEARRVSNASYRSGQRIRKTLVTQIDGIKKTFESSGSKVGHVEIDILKHLIEFDQTESRRSWYDRFCCRRGFTDKELAAEEEELRKFEGEERHLHPDETNSSNVVGPRETLTPREGASASGSSSSPDQVVRYSSGNFYGGTNNVIDLRMCQCALLQAKICVEMVFHYREAKKYGRCLQNLLDAAESDVIVGNGTQALVHIEDAIGLLKQVKCGDLPTPEKDDPDDSSIDEKEGEAQIEFLSGLAYFEIGVNVKAREYFWKALHRLGLIISNDEGGVKRESAIIRAKLALFKTRKLRCLRKKSKQDDEDDTKVMDESWRKKIRILSYLHSLFKSEKKTEMALLVTIWQVIIAEQFGDVMFDIVPAYSNMMDIYAALSKHGDAKRYERLALEMIKNTVGTVDQIEPVGLITTGGLFFSISRGRLFRGEVESSAKASYLALRISQTIHDNSLTVRVLPLLCQALLLSLKISELAEALQRLWFLAEESDDCKLTEFCTKNDF